MLIERWVMDQKTLRVLAFSIVVAAVSMSFSSFAGREGPDREMAVINSLDGRAIRDGDSLRLKLKDGTEKIYINENECEGENANIDHCFSFRLHGYFEKHNMYVLSMQYWEGGEYLFLMGDTGVDEFIRGFPVFSPSSEQFVTINYGWGYTDSISIWRKFGDRFQEVWNRKHGCPNGGGGFFNVEMDYWLSDTEIVFIDALLFDIESIDLANKEVKKYHSKFFDETGYRIEPKAATDANGNYLGFLKLPVVLINRPVGSDHWDFAALPETCK